MVKNAIDFFFSQTIRDRNEERKKNVCDEKGNACDQSIDEVRSGHWLHMI